MFEFIKHNIIGKPLLLTVALSPLFLSGCINEEGACPDDVSKSDGTWLSMRVVNADSRQGRSRADGAGHPDEAADDPENYIDGRDMSIMLLDNRQMVRHVFAPDEISMHTTVVDGSTVYDLKFKLNSDYFSYAGSLTNVDFSLMVVANRTGLGGVTSTFGTDMLSKTPLMIAKGYPSFTMPDQATAAWMPNRGTNRIPMSGIMTVTGKNLSVTNTAENPLNVGTVTLQRNLCKVRILGDLDGHADGPSEYNKITSVKLVGSSNKGAFIPLLSETDAWYTNTTVLESPTVKEGENGWWNAAAEVNMLAASQTSVVYNKTYDNAFYCYVPEAVLTGTEAKLVITANYDDDETRTRTWELPLGTNYTAGGTTTTATPSFVRNHIYEYLVQAVSGAKLTLTLNVVDWDSQTVEWDYSDNPGVAEGGLLEWTDPNGATVTLTSNPAVAQLVFDSDQTKAATGSFQFSQPLGGTWTASFAPIGNTEADAFCFVDADGKLVNTISGSIDGTKSSIQIRPRFEPATGRSRSALLIFSVRTPDGRTLSGDLVDGDLKHFTVVQNLN